MGGPSSNLFTHFGQSSVALFFMVTGLLFFTKLLESNSRPIDWLRLFVSRALRIVPLYVFAIGMCLLIVGILSDFQLRVPVGQLARGALRWLSFAMLATYDMNQVKDSWTILASVTWSLKYEWFFYLALPVFAVLFRVTVPLPFAIIGVLAVALASLEQLQLIHFTMFLGGLFAALCARHPRIRLAASGTPATVCAIACIAIVVTGFDTAYGIAQVALLSVAFTLVACGNSLFGALTHDISRTLGDLSYSIYLLHSILLTIAFRIVIDADTATNLSTHLHWGVILACVPALIALSLATYSLVEKPAMSKVDALTDALRRSRSR
ncbi:MAG: acyltransferase [Burkholderiaceae bacterium]